MKKIFTLIILGLFLVGCRQTLPVQPTDLNTPTSSMVVAENTPAVMMSPTPLHTRIPSPTPIIPDSGWVSIKQGLETRTINLTGDTNALQESVFILRFNPNEFTFQIHSQSNPISMEEWLEQSGAFAVVNGGYFWIEEENYYPSGLTIINGEINGISYGEFAGMFTISGNQVNLRWLKEQPFTPAESIDYALQSFPLLVKPGGVLGFPLEYEDGQTARRTVLGMDRDGNLLIILTQRGFFTLHTISKFLSESDLNLDIAVNLDGGPSTGFLLTEPYLKIPSGSFLPFVITIHD